MASSLLVKTLLVMVLSGTSLTQITRAPLAPQWATTAYPGFPGYQGTVQGIQGYQGTGQGFRQGIQGYQGAGQGFRQGVQGYPGGDGRYGFEIVEAPDRYGYVSNYPGGRTSFFLLGPNRGPGQQSWRGSPMSGGVGSMASYSPTTSSMGAGGWR